MNKLRLMFEETEDDKQSLNKIIQKLKDDKHCRFCVYAEERPHYEMGYDAGTDIYCTILNELRLSYPTGQQCLFWQMKEDDV